jgi:hypothetical protein
MTEIQTEHAHGRFGEGCLSFDFIVKQIAESATEEAPIKMSIEIFQVPLFLLEPKLPGVKPPTETSRRDLSAYRAYVCGGEIPPLIPA